VEGSFYDGDGISGSVTGGNFLRNNELETFQNDCAVWS